MTLRNFQKCTSVVDNNRNLIFVTLPFLPILYHVEHPLSQCDIIMPLALPLCIQFFQTTFFLSYRMVPESNKREDFHVSIEFLTWPIIRYKREVLFGWIDLLVSFGGIAGLFLGFSLLSGVEIIYYFTMRASCMLYKNRVI
jgi:hypothetical protein